MSPHEAAQYRAFYAQQLASEEALERWSPSSAQAPAAGDLRRAFYAQQPVSEEALER